MKRIAFALFGAVSMQLLCSAAETNILSKLTLEGREARKAILMRQFDLDSNGKLDRAERGLLRADLKSRIDPQRKRIIVQTNAVPSR